MTLKVGVGKVTNRGGSLSTSRARNLRPRLRWGSDCAGPSFSIRRRRIAAPPPVRYTRPMVVRTSIVKRINRPA